MTQTKISVAKFGGTSMGSAAAMRRAVEIVSSTKPSLVVVSAVSGVTNQLESIMRTGSHKEVVRAVREKHLELCKTLKIATPNGTIELLSKLESFDFKSEFSPERCDQLYSFGERLSSSIFTEVVSDSVLVDAAKLIKTDSNHTRATVDYAKTASATSKKLTDYLNQKTIITQGFIGSDSKGLVTTLGRGGSDFSAAILTEAIQANELTIWTDAAGVFSADPRIVKDAQVIPKLTYNEATEYAYAGAKIIHPPTIAPLKRSGTDLRIRNTFKPKLPGTLINPSNKTSLSISGVVAKKGQILITLNTPQMSEPYGYLAKLFSIFSAHSISIDQVITSETAVSISMKSQLHGHDNLMSELRQLGEVKIDRDISIVSVVGNNITNHSSAASRIIQAAGNVNLRGLNQGASANVFCLLVDDIDADKCVRNLHKKVIIGS